MVMIIVVISITAQDSQARNRRPAPWLINTIHICDNEGQEVTLKGPSLRYGLWLFSTLWQ